MSVFFRTYSLVCNFFCTDTANKNAVCLAKITCWFVIAIGIPCISAGAYAHVFMFFFLFCPWPGLDLYLQLTIFSQVVFHMCDVVSLWLLICYCFTPIAFCGFYLIILQMTSYLLLFPLQSASDYLAFSWSTSVVKCVDELQTDKREVVKLHI